MSRLFFEKETASHRREPIDVHQFLATPLLPLDQKVTLSKDLSGLFGHVKDLIKMLITNSARVLSDNTRSNLEWLKGNCNTNTIVKGAIESAKQLYGDSHFYVLKKLLCGIGYIHPVGLDATATVYRPTVTPQPAAAEGVKKPGPAPISPASSTSAESAHSKALAPLG